MHKRLSIVLIVLFPFFAQAQYVLDTYYEYGDLLYEDHIYQPGIKTVKLHPDGKPLEFPIIKLNSGEQLVLKFDDLYEDFANYQYTIYHCNAVWTPSGLMEAEYLGSLSEDYLQNYTYSLNALIPYTHYELKFPNNNLQLKKSGNYVIAVYRDNDKSNLVLSRRFMVYEDLVNVGAKVKRPTAVELMQTHQEIDFTISHPNYHIQNPFADLQVHLMQNFRYDNAITSLKPQFLQNSQLIYQYDKENTFPGLNEFRFFDIKNLLTLTQNVRNIERDSLFRVFLVPDASRAISEYAVWFDINGKFTIRRLDAGDSDSEADYALVDFYLSYPQPLETGDVYIFGQLTDWKMRPEFKMSYDYTRNAYRAQVFLKQGYYNYYYATTAPNEDLLTNVEKFEGSHWETENLYQILVYNREVGLRYDRLVGFNQFSSEELY